MNKLRDLPAVEELLQSSEDLIEAYGRPLTLDAIRSTLEDIRSRVRTDLQSSVPSRDLILAQAESYLSAWTAATLIPVVNATGVILHTNLGRAPLSEAALRAMDMVSRSYSNLEYDLSKGERGNRHLHAESTLRKMTGADAAVIVNNNAAAILLLLAALASRKRVVIARSQLVEIGGGFRIPDVMKQSGARLAEVGTTNKVHLSDYTEALEQPAALVMRAHRSNFRIVGFTEEPKLAEIVKASHSANVPVADDIGSGALLDTAAYGLEHEPTVQESLAAGADLVCFSGDKLLGGPQAGIIVGRKELIDRIKKHPLARAVRADKTCLAALNATLLHYLREEATGHIPVWQMISATPAQLKFRAEAWRLALELGNVIPAESTVGGGSLPGERLPTYVLALEVNSPDRFLKNLREGNPPVVARTEKDRILLDPRTVLPHQEESFLTQLKKELYEV